MQHSRWLVVVNTSRNIAAPCDEGAGGSRGHCPARTGELVETLDSRVKPWFSKIGSVSVDILTVAKSFCRQTYATAKICRQVFLRLCNCCTTDKPN